MTRPDGDRAAAIQNFLASARWGDVPPQPLAGDASTRRYLRLRRGDASVLLMDAPPKAESAACPPEADEAERRSLGYNAVARLAGPDSRRFEAFAGALRARGLKAPEVLAANFDEGLLLLEDMGDDLFARVIERGAEEAPIYRAAMDVLVTLHGAPAPEVLKGARATSPLLTYDRIAYKAEADLAVEWLYPLVTGRTLPADLRAEWDALWLDAIGPLADLTRVIVLRDYHAENLFWLPQGASLQRVGLIDFQDGLRGAPAYDVVSLLQDARRDVAPELEAAMLCHYLERARELGVEEEAFRASYALLGAQRNAKILGIFARLWKRDGKPGYLPMLPRVWRYMEADLAGPGLAPLRRWFDTHMPPDLRGAPAAV